MAASLVVVEDVGGGLELSMRAREEDVRRDEGRLLDSSSGWERCESCALRVDVAGDVCCEVRFVAVRPRTSSASSAADFFLDLSSSEERLDDMMVSSVPIARLLRLPPSRRLRSVFVCRSSSDVTA